MAFGGQTASVPVPVYSWAKKKKKFDKENCNNGGPVVLKSKRERKTG
jgi:hypothetical protein